MKSKKRKFYGANPESVRAENVKDGGTFYLDLPDDIELWTPKEGDNYIRILPSCDKDFNIWCHIWIHYNPQSKKYFLCPKEMSPKNSSVSPCPVCEEYENLKDAGEEDKVCNQFKPGAKTLFFIIDREDEKKGVQVYAASRWQVAVSLFEQMEDKRRNVTLNIADSDEGYDVKVMREGSKRNTSYKAFIDRNPSPIGFDSWEDDLVSFGDIIAEEQPYKVIKTDFFGAGVDEEEEEEEEEDVPVHSPPRKKGMSRREELEEENEEEEEEEKEETARDRLRNRVRGRK